MTKEMSQSKFQITNNKFQFWSLFVICILEFGISPKLAHAKTLNFGTQTWDVSVIPGQSAEKINVRNDFDFVMLAKNSLLGTAGHQTVTLWDNETANKINDVAGSIDRQTHDASLVVENKIATAFDPGQSGQALDVYALSQQLASPGDAIQLPVLISDPTYKLADTNSLGIRELVAVGVSDFTGSPKNRIANIGVGAAKFDGIIVDPGQEFSFNQNLGDVDAQHGFLPELVIKPSGVTPEFGGGLCQVSTTAFRAAMNAGLPITARRNHSFAVQYYAPQGTDATIYPGSADLKFINNLTSSLLIHTRIDGKKLYFEYYGTKDARTVSFDGPTQYDKKPDGSMKATWTRHVALNGQTADQTFNSNYLPPALFHHDSVVQTSTPNPQAQTH
jgi:vancomycin resistance protein YoaR